MTSSKDFDQIHPILDAMTHTVIDLYQNHKSEQTRLRLLEMESLLEEKLAEIQKAKEEG